MFQPPSNPQFQPVPTPCQSPFQPCSNPCSSISPYPYRVGSRPWGAAPPSKGRGQAAYPGLWSAGPDAQAIVCICNSEKGAGGFIGLFDRLSPDPLRPFLVLNRDKKSFRHG